ncbi:hypothetical protein AAJP85_11425, partial [Staphylococcus epidermidis]
NIRKVTAQRAENNQKNNKKDNFYIISIEIVFFYLSWDFMSHTLYVNYLIIAPCFLSASKILSCTAFTRSSVSVFSVSR